MEKMKKLIIIFITLSFVTNAQKDTSGRIKFVEMGEHNRWIWRMDTLTSCYKLWSDSYNVDCNGKITIKDTMAAFRSLLKWIEFKDSVIKKREVYACDLICAINSAIDYTNNLPGYLKSDQGNCRWSKYQKGLRKIGVSYYRCKPKPICTK
jgi:hypothetical protein